MNRNSQTDAPPIPHDRRSPPPPRGTVVPFPGAARRERRPGPRSGEPRGEILLFLGVRYERLAS